MDNDDDTMSGRKKPKGSLTPPPTLDLSASEVVVEGTTPAEPAPEGAEPSHVPVEAAENAALPVDARADETSPPPADGSAGETSPPVVEPAAPEPPPWGTPIPEAVASETVAPETSAEEKPVPEPALTDTAVPRLDVFDEPPAKPASALPVLAAALIGGVAGGALMLGVALWGLLPGSKTETPATDASAALAPRLAGIEQDIAATRKIADDTASRIAAVESAAKAASDTATSAVNLAAEAKSVATQATDKIAQLPPGAGAPTQGAPAAAVDLSPLTSRLAKAEAAAQALQAALAPLDDKTAAAASGLAEAGKRLDAVEKSLAAGPSDKTAAYVVALAGIGEALREGRPFAPELAAASAIGGRADALAPLAPLASKGSASVATLSSQFEALAPKLVEALTPKAAEPPPDAGVVDRFWFSIVNSGTVTREGEALPGEPGQPVREIGDRIRRGDLAGAVEAFRALPEAARKVGADWLAQASAALDAQALIRTETAATLQKLSKQ